MQVKDSQDCSRQTAGTVPDVDQPSFLPRQTGTYGLLLIVKTIYRTSNAKHTAKMPSSTNLLTQRSEFEKSFSRTDFRSSLVVEDSPRGFFADFGEGKRLCLSA